MAAISGGRRGVADAHLAGREQIVPRGHELRRDVGSDIERTVGLDGRHRGSGCEVAGAGAHLPVMHAGELRHVGRDADVDDVHRGADLTGDDVDRGAPGDEVGHHLRGHLLGPGRDARSDHAVIAGEHRHGWSRRNRRWAGAGDRGELHTERLESAQRAARFRELFLARHRRVACAGVEGWHPSSGASERTAASCSPRERVG